MNLDLIRIRILLLEHGKTLKDILPLYPRAKGGQGISRPYFYKALKKDPRTVESNIVDILK